MTEQALTTTEQGAVDYYEVDAMSASAIKQGAVSMLQMHHYLNHPMKSSPAMRTGTLRHMALLEPEKFEALLVCDESKQNKKYKDLAGYWGSDDIVTSNEYQSNLQAVRVVMTHPVAKGYMLAKGECEKEYFWDTDGKPCKAKLDKVTDCNEFIEFKTTASLAKFQNTSAQMNYHLQLGWYSKAANTENVIVIVQESKAPYDVAVYRVRGILVKQYYDMALEVAKKYWIAQALGRYQGQSPEEVSFEMPSWAYGCQAEEVKF